MDYHDVYLLHREQSQVYLLGLLLYYADHLY